MKTPVRSVLIGGMMLASSTAFALNDAHWTYSGAGGPDEWATLTPEYRACAGKNQSPINLTGFIKADLKPIRFAYRAGGTETLNNGHAVQVNYAAGSSITVEGIRFGLTQFHFHVPSENLINGRSFPMEAHLVHEDQEGNLAVIAVMFKEGTANKALAKLWPFMPKTEGERNTLPSPLSAEGLLPSDRAYYRFNGSLTTPPCSEGVRWLVLKKTVPASKEQVNAFLQALKHPNNRPVQPVHARPVLR